MLISMEDDDLLGVTTSGLSVLVAIRAAFDAAAAVAAAAWLLAAVGDKEDSAVEEEGPVAGVSVVTSAHPATQED